MSKYLCTPCATAIENDDMSLLNSVSYPAPFPEQYVEEFNKRYGNVVISPDEISTGKWEKCESCKYGVLHIHEFEPIITAQV